MTTRAEATGGDPSRPARAAIHGRAAEAALTGAAGAGLGALAGSLVSVPLPAAIVGGLNGVLGGWRQIYDWRSARGCAAFALDSTWALVTTTAGLGAHVLGRLPGDPGYEPRLSRRANRHVYARGFRPRKGFAITVGNVVNGAGDVDRARRAKLVTDHEDVHVWQARWLGPAFPLLYVGWMVVGGAAGGVVWLVRRRRERLWTVVESCGYYLNPFEWWAYSRDGHWPPNGLVAGLGWRRPIVRSFADRRRARAEPTVTSGVGPRT